jgi:hypothetical protein
VTGSGADQVSLGFLDHLLQVQAVPHVKLVWHAAPDIVREFPEQQRPLSVRPR